ncbi:MAG: AAA family ATPase [Blastocatellia bacterium]
MIESVHFYNFKVLRGTTLPLERFTLIVGPNGSGKSTAFQGLQAIGSPENQPFRSIASAGALNKGVTGTEIIVKWGWPYAGAQTRTWWNESGWGQESSLAQGVGSAEENQTIRAELGKIRVYSLDSRMIAHPVQLDPNIELQPDGGHLATVLDQLRDQDERRFEVLNEALAEWLPEFDRILFETPSPGSRAFVLRTRREGYRIKASDLSQGTLLALAILTLAYLPNPPSVVCLEEPDRGIHPRLLRGIQEAFYRLSYPENYGDQREPVQVITNPFALLPRSVSQISGRGHHCGESGRRNAFQTSFRPPLSG